MKRHSIPLIVWFLVVGAAIVLTHTVARAQARDEKAFQISQQTKCDAFKTLLLNRNLDYLKSASSSDVKEEKRLQNAIDTTRAALFSSESSPQAKMDELKRLMDSYQNLVNRLKTGSPEYAEAKKIHPLTFAEIQRALDQETAVLDYFIAGETTYLWIISRDRVTAAVCPAGGTRAQSLAFDLKEAVKAGDSTAQNALLRDAAKAAGIDEITRFLDSHGTIRRLAICPSEHFSFIPFGALPDARDRPLIEKAEVVYLPCFSALRILRERERKEKSRIAAFAIGKESWEGLPSRPKTIGEVKTISASFPIAEVFVSEDFTGGVLESHFGFADVIHIATTGTYDSESPSLSFFASADGEFSIMDIMGVKIRCSLATLDFDGSAWGTASPSEEVISFQRAFLAAGASSVLGALWGVDDATTEFMRTFYEKFQRMDKAGALAETQREMSKSGKPVSSWANFTLWGDCE